VVVIPITTEIDTFIARRAGREMAREAGFSSRDYSLIEIAVSELTSNVIKYASHGTIRLNSLPDGMEIICEDDGPGIPNPTTILTRPSKSNTGLGIGLLGVSHIMDQFEISGGPDRGTIITARKWKILPAHLTVETAAVIPEDGLLEYGAFSVPCRQEELNGDALVIEEGDRQVLLAVIDGLGHGQEAHRASQKAAAYIRAHTHLSLTALLEDCHSELRRTRGAVIGLVRIDLCRSLLTCAGIGNITTKIAGRQLVLHPLSAPGIVGHRIKPAKEEVLPFLPGDLLFLHSDGISSRFDPKVLGTGISSARRLAERILHEHGKYHDDQTIIVARRKDAEAAG
jgi:anti-sigma regulatory factor (Ser/Thr protein kinase)